MTTEEILQQANNLLHIAEDQFGKRVEEWIFTGVQITDHLPAIVYYPEAGEIKINLSKKVECDDLQLIFQMAHEVCHVLHPSKQFPSLKQTPTLVINEGLSTLFSIMIAERYFKAGSDVVYSLMIYHQNYYDAFTALHELISIDHSSIKKLREIKPRINELTAVDFDKAGLKVSDELKVKLLTPF